MPDRLVGRMQWDEQARGFNWDPVCCILVGQNSFNPQEDLLPQAQNHCQTDMSTEQDHLWRILEGDSKGLSLPSGH